MFFIIIQSHNSVQTCFGFCGIIRYIELKQSDKTGDSKSSTYLITAAIGPNMYYMQTHVVYNATLNKHCLTI
jgi:hypothetical protein